MSRTFRLSRIAAVLVSTILVLVSSRPSPAYSVLTHEQVVDSLWRTEMKRILLERYPNTTPEELKKAHAYAYGGALIQDMGYYPYGSKLYSDLVHYVRSGDFVSALIRDSHDVNELAFALGALAHYVSDTRGHPAVNQAVARTFPRLGKRYGAIVTYSEDPKAHTRTEFGFDVVEVAEHRYASSEYHDFIGFEVAQPLLERAFFETYGIPLSAVLPNEHRAIESYRHALGVWIPRFTEVALINQRQELQAVPNFNRKEFRYRLRRRDYEREWSKDYAKPVFVVRFLAVLVKIFPVGRLAQLKPAHPDKPSEKLFVDSVAETVRDYRDFLEHLDAPAIALADRDLDTGQPTRAAEYDLADKTYAKLLKLLAKNGYAQTTPELRANLLNFYSDLTSPIETKRHKNDWNEVLHDLDALKKLPGPAGVQGAP